MPEVFEIEFNTKTGRFYRVGYRPGRWDGTAIYLTKNCPGCPCLREVNDLTVEPRRGSKIVGVCVHGVTWKAIHETDKPRKCSKEPKEAHDVDQ